MISVNDRCWLVAILGMGGIGKTALSVKLGQPLATPGVMQWGQSPVRATSPAAIAFEFVIWRSLIEAREGKFTQQPVVMEYITDELIERCCAEITSEVPDLLLSHALIKAQSKDYIRESQVRQILQPLIEQLKGQFPWPSQLEQALQRFLLILRSPDYGDRRQPSLPTLSDYGPGNLLNLMSYLKLDLTGYDFSRLIVQQAYLHDVSLHQVNFTDATFINSVFAEPLHNNHGLAFSPDGQLLAMTGLDGSLNLFYVATQQRYLTLAAHLGWTLGVAFSPDATTLVTGSFDQTIKLWDLQDGRCLRSWSTDTAVWRVSFSPDGQHIISANEDHTIRVWDGQTGQCVRTLTGHTAPVIVLNVSGNGLLLVSAGFDQTVRVWDLTTGHCRHVLKGHTDSVGGWRSTRPLRGWLALALTAPSGYGMCIRATVCRRCTSIPSKLALCSLAPMETGQGVLTLEG